MLVKPFGSEIEGCLCHVICGIAGLCLMVPGLPRSHRDEQTLHLDSVRGTLGKKVIW